MLKDGLGDHSRLEEEYFYKKDRELIDKMKAAEAQKSQLLERTQHYHKCPKCGLGMEERVLDAFSYLMCNSCESLHFSVATMEQLLHKGQIKILATDLRDQLNQLKESA